MGDFGTSAFFEYTELLLDSTDALISGSSNYNSNDWPLFYYTSKKPNIACIKVIEAEIPFVFDIISSVNNTLIYIESGVEYLITVPTGSYDEVTLAANLEAAIQVVRPAFTVVWSAVTRTYTFTEPSPVSWGLKFVGVENLYSILGFLKNTTYTASGAGSTIVSGAGVREGNYLQINSKIIGPYIECNTTDSSPGGGITPVICRLPLTAGVGSLIRYASPNPTMWFDYIGNQIENFDLYLTLNQNTLTPLDMKNANWSVKLGILTYRSGAISKGAPVIGKTLQ